MWLELAAERLLLPELEETLTDERAAELPVALADATPCDADAETSKSLARPTVSMTLPSARCRMMRQLSAAGAAPAAEAIAATAARQLCARMFMVILRTGAAG